MRLMQTLHLLYGLDSTETATPIRRKYGRKAMQYPPNADTDPQLAKQVQDQRQLESLSRYGMDVIMQGKPGKMIDVTPDGNTRTREKQKAFDPVKQPLRRDV